jgi:membrane protease YdiL (CAAX protease family)
MEIVLKPNKLSYTKLITGSFYWGKLDDRTLLLEALALNLIPMKADIRKKSFIVGFVMLVCTLLVIPIFLLIQALNIDPSSLQGIYFEVTFINTFLVLLFSGAVIGLIFLVQKFIHKKPIRTLGFSGEFKRNFIWGHIFGLLIGLIYISIIFLKAPVANVTYAVSENTSLFELADYYIFFFIFLLTLNSLKEELVYRAYPLEQLMNNKNILPYVIIVAALLFSLFHHFLEPFTWGAFVNRFLVGILTGILYSLSRSIWGIIGFHNGINLAEITFSGNWKIGGLFKLADSSGNLIENVALFNIVLLITLVATILSCKRGLLQKLFPKNG